MNPEITPRPRGITPDGPPASLVSIDAGTRHAGVAVWVKGQLYRAFLVDVRKSKRYLPQEIYLQSRALAPAPTLWVAELPRKYEGRRSTHNTVAKMTTVLKALDNCPLDYDLAYVTPHQWKGNVPKQVTQARALALLSGPEYDRIKLPPKKDVDDVWDAIGIGLWALGRALRGTIPPRGV